MALLLGGGTIGIEAGGTHENDEVAGDAERGVLITDAGSQRPKEDAVTDRGQIVNALAGEFSAFLNEELIRGHEIVISASQKVGTTCATREP